MSVYDPERAFYVLDNGAMIPVASAGPTDMLEHLAHPALFMANVRAAVCNQAIELNWMTVMTVQDGKRGEPHALCPECLKVVETVFQ